MPTVAEIERLEALIDRLLPLSDKQRGELIAADDWNALVGALIEVGRAALSMADGDVVPPHEHADEVGIGWLDPRVRQLVTGGGLKDPAVETEFLKLRRDLTSLAGRVDRVSTDVDRSRIRIDEVATNDLAREALLDRLNRKVLGAADDRADIADLRSTLSVLQTEVGRAVEVGALLESNGRTIDVPELAERVGAVEVLRDRLTWPDGELMDAASLEIRLQEMQTDFVRQGDLTEAIDDVRDEIGSGGVDTGALLDEARLAGREAAASSVETLGLGLRSEIDARFESIRPTVDESVANATEGLRDEILSAARSELDEAVSGGDAAVRADLEALVDERVGGTESLIDERFASLPDLVGSQVANQLGRQLDGLLADIDSRFANFDERLVDVEQRVGRNAGAIDETTVRFETARRDDAAARAGLRAELLDQLAGVDGQIDSTVTASVDAARSVLRTDLEATVGATRRDLESVLARVARDAAATEVKVLATSIRTDVQSIIRQEIEAGVASVRDEIAGELASLDKRVAGMVSTAVSRATAGIPRLVTEELEAFRPELTRIIDERVGRTRG